MSSWRRTAAEKVKTGRTPRFRVVEYAEQFRRKNEKNPDLNDTESVIATAPGTKATRDTLVKAAPESSPFQMWELVVG